MKLLITREVFLFIFLLSFTGLKAQNVAICDDGSPPHPSAMLEISSMNKGILMPQVALVGRTSPMPVAANREDVAVGLLVYNVGADLDQGFYYWGGNEWLQFTSDVYVEHRAQYGELYESNSPAGGSPMYLLYNQWIGWKSADAGICSDSIVPDVSSQVSDKLTVLESGTYMVNVNVSFMGSENAHINGSLFVNGARYPKISFSEKIASNGDLSSAGSGGIVQLNKYDTVDLRMLASNAYETIEMIYVNVRLTRLGD